MTTAEQRLETARRAQTAARIASRKARSALEAAEKRGASAALLARRQDALAAARDVRLTADAEYIAADAALDAEDAR